jgi:hypothetical protein
VPGGCRVPSTAIVQPTIVVAPVPTSGAIVAVH